MSCPSLGPAADAALRALTPAECTAVEPQRCYCARGTTKPIAEISPTGAVLRVFCSGPEAIRVLVSCIRLHCMCLTVYAHYMILWPPQGVRRDEVYGNVDKTQALKSGCYLRYIPGGKCKNAGVFKVHGERAQRPPVPRTFHEACSLDPSPLEPGAKRSRAPTTLFSVLQHMATARSTRAAESSGSEDGSEAFSNSNQ